MSSVIAMQRNPNSSPRLVLCLFVLAALVSANTGLEQARAQGLAVDNLDDPAQPSPPGEASQPVAVPTQPPSNSDFMVEGVSAKSCAQVNRQQLFAGLIPAIMGLLLSMICLVVLVKLARPGPFLRVVVSALIGAIVAPVLLALLSPAPTPVLAECLSSPVLRSEMWMFTSKALAFALAAAASGLGFLILVTIFKPFHNIYRARR